MTNKISFCRQAAAQSQKWHCYYRGLPMGGKGSPNAKAVSSEKKRLLITAEHLHARQDGGKRGQGNIVAAHTICNWRRHRRKKPITPLKFVDHVKLRIEKNRWFVGNDLKQLIEALGPRARPEVRQR